MRAHRLMWAVALLGACGSDGAPARPNHDAGPTVDDVALSSDDLAQLRVLDDAGVAAPLDVPDDVVVYAHVVPEYYMQTIADSGYPCSFDDHWSAAPIPEDLLVCAPNGTCTPRKITVSMAVECTNVCETRSAYFRCIGSAPGLPDLNVNYPLTVVGSVRAPDLSCVSGCPGASQVCQFAAGCSAPR